MSVVQGYFRDAWSFYLRWNVILKNILFDLDEYVPQDAWRAAIETRYSRF